MTQQDRPGRIRMGRIRRNIANKEIKAARRTELNTSTQSEKINLSSSVSVADGGSWRPGLGFVLMRQMVDVGTDPSWERSARPEGPAGKLRWHQFTTVFSALKP